MDKVHIIEKLVFRLKNKARSAFDKSNYEKALLYLHVCSNVLYEYNQRYKDDDIEQLLMEIGNNVIHIPQDYRPKEIKPVKTVLYYDGFGLDLRGLTANLIKTIGALGYKLIYITKKSAFGKQPHIVQELQSFDVVFLYVDSENGFMKWIHELNDAFLKYEPQVAYFYTTPYDVSGTVVFNQYRDRVIRFLINLTDHAFWIGLNTFDYITADREVGAWINFHERNIPIDKMYSYRFSVFICEKTPLGPLPFDVKKNRFVFSGGSLYKTLGDPNLYFYRIIEHIITKYPDVNYLYAGEGDSRELDKLIAKYPNRVYLVHEREDFFQIIEESLFYLNTYPMFGGQMMRYAACAGKLPVTLKHNDDAVGVLLHQKELGLEFDTYLEVIEEIDKLITNDEYRNQKESKLKIAVVSFEEEKHDQAQMIEKQISPQPVFIKECDTKQFRQEYIERLDFSRLIMDVLFHTKSLSLAMVYSIPIIKALAHKMLHLFLFV